MHFVVQSADNQNRFPISKHNNSRNSVIKNVIPALKVVILGLFRSSIFWHKILKYSDRCIMQH